METREAEDTARIAQTRSPLRNLDIKVIDEILANPSPSDEDDPVTKLAKAEIRAERAKDTDRRR